MSEVSYYGTGRRKTSIAKVRLREGDGKISINEKSVDSYFPREAWKIRALEPLKITQTQDKYNVSVDVSGGGLTGQSDAVRHGLARALLQASAAFKKTLKSAALLTRDPRMVESKKYGKRKARRGQQFSKR